MYLITSHLNTDFDSLASMVAISKLYPDAVICPPGSMSRKVRDFISRKGHQWAAKILKPKKIPLDEVTLMIVVDTRSRQRIGSFAALAGRQDVAVHVYDHHPATPDDIPAEEFIYEPIGAVTTMIFEQLLNERKEITPDEATLFALGIYGKDTESALEEFRSDLKDAGVEAFTEEFIKQYTEYKEANGI